MSSQPAFGPTCPQGGSWYACASGTNFVGCCTRDPCSTRCPQGDLRQAGFNPDYHGNFSDAQCQPGGASFYTCSAGPTFLGCCKSNPCATGTCPTSDLDLSFIYADDLKAEYGAISSSSPSRTLSASATRTASASSSSTATRDAAVTTAPHKDGPPVAAIAGGAAGGTFAIALIVGLLIYYFCHAKKSRKGHEESLSRRQSNVEAIGTMNKRTKHPDLPDTPPGYSSPKPEQLNSRISTTILSLRNMHTNITSNTIWSLKNFPSSPSHQKTSLESPHRISAMFLSFRDTAIRSELESSYTTPKIGHFKTPPAAQTGFDNGQGSQPVSPAMGHWSPQQNWQTPIISEYSPGPGRGLGLQVDNSYGTTERGGYEPQSFYARS